MYRLEQIYDAIFDEEAFQALPELFAREFGATSAIINWVHSDGDKANLAYSHYTPEFMAQYAEHFIGKDLWFNASVQPRWRNKMVNASEMITQKTWEKSEIYNELVRPSGYDTFHCMGGSFFTPWGAGLLGINRDKSQGGFSDEDVRRLNESAEALKRVLMVRGEIAAHRRQGGIAAAALDMDGAPTVVVLANHEIVHANLAAEAALRSGSAISRKGRVLAAATEEGRRRLAVAIGQAIRQASPRTSAVLVPRVSPGGLAIEPLSVTITPLAGAGGQAKALLVFRDPEQHDPTVGDRLKGLYHLSNAEADLAMGLAQGASLADTAERRGVRESTVRSQMKTLAAKMNRHRQGEIIAAVAALPPLPPKGSRPADFPHLGDAGNVSQR